MTSSNTGIQEVTITRTFDAPRELVFKAWTDPELIKQWFGPAMFTIPLAELDVRPGGKFLIHMQGPDGTIYPDIGTYHVIEPPERLVFVDGAFEQEDGSFLLEVLNTLTLVERSSKTEMTLHCEVIRATPEVQWALAGMEQGWSESFEKLETLLINNGHSPA
jgi:uncharacterized protein YndB with AHSA1/START domain